MEFSENELTEILNIFQVEAEEIISKMNNSLLDLERNPKNKELISYIFFSKTDVINKTDNIKPVTHPTPILHKNLNAFILSTLLPDIKLFKEFTKSS